MNNYEAIMKMTPKQMRAFLDHVYLTGVNNGLYMARLNEEETESFDPACYTLGWLFSDAENATSKVFDDDGDTFLPEALTEAIFRNAGIVPESGKDTETEESGECGVKIVIGASVKIREHEELNLEDLTMEELENLLEELNVKLDSLEDKEPDDSFEEYESWEDAVERIEDAISQVEDAIDEYEEN